MAIGLTSIVEDYIRLTLKPETTQRLNINNPVHLSEAARIIKNGGVVALAFNGVYGLFGDVNNEIVADKIFKIKNRPKSQKLVIVSPPEYITEFVYLKDIPYEYKNLSNLWKE